MPHKKKLLEKGIKSTIIGILVNLILASIKIISGIIGNSYALIADGIESVTDIFTSAVVYTGLKMASRPPDENHPYGHGKAEPFAAIVVAAGIFLAALIITIQSVREIITPHHSPAPFTLIVLLAVIAVKETLFRYIFKVGINIKSTAVKNDAWHHRSDAITSLAAFVGISIALIGGKGYESADDYAALFASAIIFYNAYILFKPAFYELMDTSPSPEFIQEIKTTALQVEGVQEIEKCFGRKMGLDYFIDIHVVVNGSLTVRKGHDIAHSVKEIIKKRFIEVNDVLVHIEPASENNTQ